MQVSEVPLLTPERQAADLSPLQLTHRNHFKFGYDQHWFAQRRAPEDIWGVAYGRCRRPAKDWRSECIETARLIRDDTDLDLWLLFSGGIDSEVALQSFLFAGIPVTAAITCFRGDLNRQDVRHAVKFCETHQIEYRLLHLDIERFVESGAALEFADRTKCVSPQLLHTMWAMDQVDGYPILGSGECYLVKRSAQRDGAMPGAGPDVWEMFEKERIASWYRHLIARGRPGCAGFFQYNPENMLAFLIDPMVADLCGNRLPTETTTMKIKSMIYSRYFLLEPRKKYHGFENILHLDDALRPELELRYGTYNAIHKTPYGELIANLSHEGGEKLSSEGNGLQGNGLSASVKRASADELELERENGNVHF
jgi:hypothetical protein